MPTAVTASSVAPIQILNAEVSFAINAFSAALVISARYPRNPNNVVASAFVLACVHVVAAGTNL